MTRPRSVLLISTLLIALAAAATCQAETAGVDAPARDTSQRSAAPIHVPEGFIVEQVAAPPLVEHPMMACFDDHGRLFVAEAAGLNLRADALLKKPPNRIRLLEDTDGDGRFDKSTTFADQMTMPMGAAVVSRALLHGFAAQHLAA